MFAEIPTRCFVMDVDKEMAHHLNIVRQNASGIRRIPDVGFDQLAFSPFTSLLSPLGCAQIQRLQQELRGTHQGGGIR